MANDTYIKSFRKTLDNELFNEKPFDRWHAFEYMVFKAYRFPRTEIIKGQEVFIDTGQFVMSQRKMADTFGWSLGKLGRFKQLLGKLEMASFDGDTYGDSIGTLVTIENYTKYQGDKNTDGHRSANTDEHTNGYTDGHIIKKGKKGKKDNINNIYYGEFKNVALSEEELEKLKVRFPYDWQERVDRLSEYMKSKGKRYKSHYATILQWGRKDKDANQGQDKQSKDSGSGTGNTDYSDTNGLKRI